LHPRRIVFGYVHRLEFCPCGNGVRTRYILLHCEKLGDKIDVTTVRHFLESLHSGQSDVLPDEVTISGVVTIPVAILELAKRHCRRELARHLISSAAPRHCRLSDTAPE